MNQCKQSNELVKDLKLICAWNQKNWSTMLDILKVFYSNLLATVTYKLL